MQNKMPRRNKSFLPAALIVGGVVIIAAAVYLLVLFSQRNYITGPWHSEARNQLFRFHDDDTVSIHTQHGIQEGTYIFDADSGRGVITMNGKILAFTASGDRLLLDEDGTHSEFLRGEMQIEEAFAEATPTALPSPSGMPVETATPAALMTPSATQATAAVPTPTATRAPTAAPSPAVTQTPRPTQTAASTATPSPSRPPMVVRTPTPKPTIAVVPTPTGFPSLITVMGVWVRADNPGEKLEFLDDNRVNHTVPPSSFFGGEYSYDKSTRKGMLYIMGREISFTVSGNKLTLEDGTVFERE